MLYLARFFLTVYGYRSIKEIDELDHSFPCHLGGNFLNLWDSVQSRVFYMHDKARGDGEHVIYRVVISRDTSRLLREISQRPEGSFGSILPVIS